MKVGKTTDKLTKKKSINVKTNGGLGLDRGGILLDAATISPATVTKFEVEAKTKIVDVDGAAIGGKKSIHFDGEDLPDCPLDHVSIAEEINPIDVKKNGGLDLDHGDIHELKPELTFEAFDFGRKKKNEKMKKMKKKMKKKIPEFDFQKLSFELKKNCENISQVEIENPNQSKCGNQCGNQCGDQHKEHGQWKESDERNVAVSCNVSHERLTSPVHVPHRRLLLALDSFVGLGKNEDDVPVATTSTNLAVLDFEKGPTHDKIDLITVVTLLTATAAGAAAVFAFLWMSSVQQQQHTYESQISNNISRRKGARFCSTISSLRGFWMCVAGLCLLTTANAANPTCANTDGTGTAFSSGLCVADGMLRRSDWASADACYYSTCKTSDCCVTSDVKINIDDETNGASNIMIEKKEANKFLNDVRRAPARSLLSARAKKRYLHSDAKSSCISPGMTNGGESGNGVGVTDADTLYIYISSNHGSFSGKCFEEDENQGRIDVTYEYEEVTRTAWSRNPDPGEGGADRSNINIYTGGGDSPCGELDYGETTFQYGPIPLVAGGEYKAQIWNFGCDGDSVMDYLRWSVTSSSCPAGQFKSGSSCTSCTSGRYQASSGAQTSCTSCSAGKYGNGATGATSSSHCTDCSAGKYSSSTAKSSACTESCASGKYGTGGSSSSTCTGSCNAGKWGSTGQSSSSCNGDCDAGYYCTSGSTSVTQNECGGNDYYCPTGSTAPTAVPAGSFSIGGSSAETRTGKYLNEGAAHEWSTVVDISIPPHSFKLVSLSLSRSPLSKTL